MGCPYRLGRGDVATREGRATCDLSDKFAMIRELSELPAPHGDSQGGYQDSVGHCWAPRAVTQAAVKPLGRGHSLVRRLPIDIQRSYEGEDKIGTLL